MLAHYEGFTALNATPSIFLVWWLVCRVSGVTALWAFDGVCVVSHVCVGVEVKMSGGWSDMEAPARASP